MTVRLNDEEVDKYFYEVASGRRNVSVKNVRGRVIDVSIRHPTPEERIEGNRIYENVYKKALNRKILTREEMEKNFIPNNKLYNQVDIQRMSKLKSDIAVLKIGLKKPILSGMVKRQKKEKLNKLEYELFYICYEKEHKYYEATCETLSNKKRNHYFAYICPEKYGEIGTRFWKNKNSFASSINIVLVLNIIREFTIFNAGIDHGILRAIARSQKVKTMWVISTKTGAPLFGIPMSGGQQFFSQPISRWTTNQMNLAGWLNYYQNVSESSDPPPEYITEDDEKFDKFVQDMIRKKETERIKNIGSTSGKRRGSRDHEDLILFGDEREAYFSN